MTLKFIFTGIWNILKFIWKIMTIVSDNMLAIYMYMYFGYGFYQTYNKIDINDTYLLIGMVLITAYLIEYIDKKDKTHK